MRKQLLTVAAIAALAWPLGGCLEGLTSAITGAATDATQQVLDDVDAGIESGKTASQGLVDDYIAGLNGPAPISNLPLGASCTANSECASLNCISQGNGPVCS